MYLKLVALRNSLTAIKSWFRDGRPQHPRLVILASPQIVNVKKKIIYRSQKISTSFPPPPPALYPAESNHIILGTNAAPPPWQPPFVVVYNNVTPKMNFAIALPSAKRGRRNGGKDGRHWELQNSLNDTPCTDVTIRRRLAGQISKFYKFSATNY